MDSSEREFIILAVKELFRKMREGKIRFLEGQVPETVKAVEAVRFGDDGEPVFDSISPIVRTLARTLVQHDFEQDTLQRARMSPVHDYLGEPVKVDDSVLKECSDKSSFSPLAFELYKETVGVLAVCSHAYVGTTTESFALPRNQAICAGLLVRIAKFMTAVVSLVADNSHRADVVFALNRSITESATNLRFLVFKNEDRFYDQFVKFNLAPERETYDLIHKNIEERGGRVLPIEQRMLTSIEKACRLSGIPISEVPAKAGDWGGGFRNRLIALGEGEWYSLIQRLPSHAVHGTWVDLVQHHLTEVEGGFQPDPEWSRVDSRLMLPVCILVLAAARAYVKAFFEPLPELKPLNERIEDLERRIVAVDRAHEAWFAGREPEDT